MSGAYDKVIIARRVTRPTALSYINAIFEDFIELHGDRVFKDDKAVVGGIALFNGKPVTVVGIQKGATLEENIERNFGSPHPEGYRKALRLMKQAEKFNRPVILFVNTTGAYCGIGAEERGQGEAIARNLYEMSDLKVPIISFIIGEGGSGGALALAVCDKLYMLTNSVYSILSPEGFASILWRDASRAAEAADFMKMTAHDLLGLNIIDGIIDEPENGAENDFDNIAAEMKKTIETELETLLEMSIQELLNGRYERFRKFGEYYSPEV